MQSQIQFEANIAKNLIAVAIEYGIPVVFNDADVDEVLTDPEHSDMFKLDAIRRIKDELHEVLYAPSLRGS